MKKMLILVFLAFFLNLSLAQAKSKIIVGGEIDYPPYCFLDENRQPAGFQVDLTNSIARVMGIEIEIKLSSWAKTRETLENGSIDIICGMFYSPERAELYDFSPPYTIVSSVIFARRDSPYVETIEDLRGREIIVMRGEAMHDVVLQQKITDKLILADTPDEVMRKLAAGKGDYALGAQMPGLYWIKKLGLTNITTMGKPLAPFKNCFSVMKGNTLLLSQFTEGMTILNRTGEYQKLYEKWFDVLELSGFSFKKALKYAMAALLPLLALIAGAFTWSWMLRRTVALRTRELSESRRQLLTLSDNIPAGYVFRIITEGNTRRFTHLSAGVEQLHGISVADAISNAELLYSQIIDEDRPIMAENEAIALKNMGRFYVEIRYRKPPGETRWLLITSSLRHNEGEGIVADGLAIDITERKRIEESLRLSLEDKQILLKELYHRTGNNMNVIQAMLYMHLSKTEDLHLKQIIQDIGNRIQSMALVHQKLYQANNLSSIDLNDYAVDLFENLFSAFNVNRDRIRLHLKRANVPVLIDVAIPCGLILNELFTNSLKYAFPDNRSGEISVEISKESDNMVNIHYSDNGVGSPDDFNNKESEGMGIRIIRMIVEYQLNGKLLFNSNNGMKCSISFSDSNYKARVSNN